MVPYWHPLISRKEEVTICRERASLPKMAVSSRSGIKTYNLLAPMSAKFGQAFEVISHRLFYFPVLWQSLNQASWEHFLHSQNVALYRQKLQVRSMRERA